MPIISIEADTLHRRCAVCRAEHAIALADIASGPAEGLCTLLLPVCESCGSLELLLDDTSADAAPADPLPAHRSLVREVALRLGNAARTSAAPR